MTLRDFLSPFNFATSEMEDPFVINFADYLGKYHGVKTITRPPKIIGELLFGISGNDYVCHYL